MVRPSAKSTADRTKGLRKQAHWLLGEPAVRVLRVLASPALRLGGASLDRCQLPPLPVLPHPGPLDFLGASDTGQTDFRCLFLLPFKKSGLPINILWGRRSLNQSRRSKGERLSTGGWKRRGQLTEWCVLFKTATHKKHHQTSVSHLNLQLQVA